MTEFLHSNHAIMILIATGLLFIVTTILSLNGNVRNGKRGFHSKKYGVIPSFFLIVFGIKYTTSYTLFFWLVISTIIVTYLT